MRFYIFLFFGFILSLDSFAQFSPDNYYLLVENKSFSKSSSLNPTSNTITDIITIGDTVWIGTSRGVSLSTDRGENWTNFYGNPQFGTDNVSAIGYDNGIFWAATATTIEGRGGTKFTTRNRIKIHFKQRSNMDFNSTASLIATDTMVNYGINILRALPVTVSEFKI